MQKSLTLNCTLLRFKFVAKELKCKANAEVTDFKANAEVTDKLLTKKKRPCPLHDR